MSPFEWVFVEEIGWWVDLLRWVNMGLWLIAGSLVLSLYLAHRTGRMGWKAAYGSVLAFWTIALAQPVRIAEGSDDLGLVSILVFISGILCVLGAWEPLQLTLFRRKDGDDDA